MDSDGKLIPVMVRFEADTYAELKEVAARDDRSAAATIRRAVRIYLDSRNGIEASEPRRKGGRIGG